jgi:hypothetical protein
MSVVLADVLYIARHIEIINMTKAIHVLFIRPDLFAAGSIGMTVDSQLLPTSRQHLIRFNDFSMYYSVRQTLLGSSSHLKATLAELSSVTPSSAMYLFARTQLYLQATEVPVSLL